MIKTDNKIANCSRYYNKLQYSFKHIFNNLIIIHLIYFNIHAFKRVT